VNSVVAHVHEAGHLIARIQLAAAWNLAGLENPSTFESIRVWLDETFSVAMARRRSAPDESWFEGVRN
jgi:hypothetical protein